MPRDRIKDLWSEVIEECCYILKIILLQIVLHYTYCIQIICNKGVLEPSIYKFYNYMVAAINAQRSMVAVEKSQLP